MNEAASNWYGHHANMAASYFAPCDKRFLIIGCNRVEDCRYFKDMGSRHVVGFDIMIEIGVNLVHPKVSYIRTSAEMMPLPDDEFDLVYAFATLEHIPERTPGDGACLPTGRASIRWRRLSRTADRDLVGDRPSTTSRGSISVGRL